MSPAAADRPDVLTTGDPARKRHLLLAHGAGAPMTSLFLTRLSHLLDERGVTVHRFDFPYMAERAATGRRRPPPRAHSLTDAYRHAISACRARLPRGSVLFIGGKSMGGRVACLTASDPGNAAGVAGIVLVGYPFHPPGKPAQLRTAPLLQLPLPALVVQGTRDPFGTRDEVNGYGLPAHVRVTWIDDGDHDLAPRVSSGSTAESALRDAADRIAVFILKASAS